MKTKLTKTCLLLVFFTLFNSFQAYAQENREVGVRFHSNTGADVIFKKEKFPNRFKRFRVGVGNLGYLDRGGSGDFVISAGLALGSEKRKAIKEDLYFIKGWEAFAGGSSFAGNSNARLGLGYVLGFQYNVTSALAVSAEVIPNISTVLGDNFDGNLSVSAGLANNSALTLIYQFQK